MKYIVVNKNTRWIAAKFAVELHAIEFQEKLNNESEANGHYSGGYKDYYVVESI